MTSASHRDASRPPSPGPVTQPPLEAPSSTGVPSFSPSPEMTSRVDPEAGRPPSPRPGRFPIGSSSFAFGGGDDSDSSSAPSSDDDGDNSTHDVRPITRRDPPAFGRFSTRPTAAPVHTQDFAFQYSMPAGGDSRNDGGRPVSAVSVDVPVHGGRTQDLRPISPISVDVPIHGGHTQQIQREVRWQLPGRNEHVRPDTVDSEKDLPQREFYSQSSGEETKDDDDDAADGVFAFHRPPTAPQPANSMTTAPNTVSSHHPNMFEEAPIGGFQADHDRMYDMSRPPPYSGRSNPNNSVFAFGAYHEGMRRRDASRPSTTDKDYPPTTATTMTTDISSVGDESSLPPLPRHGRFMRNNMPTTGRPTTGRPSTGRPSTMGSSYATESEWTEESEPYYRPRTRDSRAVTELTGDPTIPDGATTWGDGLGGEVKESPGERDDPDVIYEEEDSPYAEVRASVSNIDDPDMPALTLRAWCLGMFLTTAAASANTFFSFRNPSPYIPSIVVQVLAHPIGKFLAWALPIREYTMPKWLGGFTFSLNPCPFNVKEHAVIVMMANIAITHAWGLNTIVVSELWYHQPLGLGFSFIYILSTQMTGLCLAGIARRFVVWPASMIWPGVLVMTTNLNTLHAVHDRDTGSMTRLKFFLICSTGAFFYYFLPGFLFTALSYFSWVCWIAPNNAVVNQLFGVSTGLGMGILSFDWSQIAWVGSPLANPWWAQLNILIGFVLFYWIIVPALYYSNVWFTGHLPIMSLQAADRYADIYNVTRLLTPEYRLNVTAYAEYSPVYLTASFNVTYMLAFALTTALVVYTALAHGPRLWQQVRHMSAEPNDIHFKLMRVYPEVREWWYLSALVICIILGIITVEVFGTGLPVWGYLVAIALAFVYIIPTAIMFALTNLEPSINLIAEMIPGFIFQGNPLAGMIFKTFAIQTLSESMFFVRDMKFGHYMKVPPRSMFIAQMSACAITSFVQVGVKEWMFNTIPDMCTSRQKDLLTCSSQRTVYSASIIWGLVGPRRLFSKGGIYNPQLWMLLFGALIPVPFWYWTRKYPRSILRNINVCVILCVCLFTPPATGINITANILVGFVFQYLIRRYRFAWWAKYNYTLSAALDVGTLLSAIVVFLVLRLPKASVTWWGNTVFQNTMDWNGDGRAQSTPPTGFGPDTWKL